MGKIWENTEIWEKYRKSTGKTCGIYGENMRNLREKYRKLWVNMVNSWENRGNHMGKYPIKMNTGL